jgi:internalin A
MTDEKVMKIIIRASEKKVSSLDLSCNQLTQLPPEIKELKDLKRLSLSNNRLTQLPPEIGKLKNLTELDLSYNWLTQLPPEIGELKNLTILNLCRNQLTKLPQEIKELKNLIALYLTRNHLTQLPPKIGEFKNLRSLYLSENPLASPPPEIVSMGLEAVLTYLKQSKTVENNEAKLILVGDARVGKTCLAHRLINNKFVEDSKITEGINISKWKIPAPSSQNSEIKLNIWDFGGQEIYHATHQFFLTTRSVYLLVWNAQIEKNQDSIYYWLYTIETFGGDSPIILVMSKMNENDDDLNLRDLKCEFPQIKDYQKIDSKDGKGISVLKEKILETAWNLPLMRVPWVDSWYRVRQRLEGMGENWIKYEDFYEICVSEGLDDKNISILDGYLHELGVTLHFKDRIALKNIVILKPEWATGAFYKILSIKSVLHREGVLLTNELEQIWDKIIYPIGIYSQFIELMNKFELLYELPDRGSYLVPELLPKDAPDFIWNKKDDLCFYYYYDYFLPPGTITRFIVRMHQDLEIKENGLPLCWREGAVLKLYNSRAFVEMKSDERQIEIRIKGGNKREKREALAMIRYHLDHINASIKKIKVSKQIPCNCSEDCPQRYHHEDLLKAEMSNVEDFKCFKSFKKISITSLLEGYERREEELEDSEKTDNPSKYDVFICHSSKDKPVIALLIEDFKKEGITYWVDEEQIDYGDQITQRIEEGLQKSRYVIPCLSKNLNASGWTRAEYGSILNTVFSGNSRRNVIPLKLDNCEDDDIPFLLRDKKRVTYSDKTDFAKFIKFLESNHT